MLTVPCSVAGGRPRTTYHNGDVRTLTDATAAGVAALGLQALNALTDDPYSVTLAEAPRFREILDRDDLAAGKTAGNYGGGLVSEGGVVSPPYSPADRGVHHRGRLAGRPVKAWRTTGRRLPTIERIREGEADRAREVCYVVATFRTRINAALSSSRVTARNDGEAS